MSAVHHATIVYDVDRAEYDDEVGSVQLHLSANDGLVHECEACGHLVGVLSRTAFVPYVDGPAGKQCLTCVFSAGVAVMLDSAWKPRNGKHTEEAVTERMIDPATCVECNDVFDIGKYGGCLVHPLCAKCRIPRGVNVLCEPACFGEA